ncbi:hypothetical protein TNCV_4010761 [Trichonephila clavipes]|nr:hypothetical protein TNCV_4010761 [Trichonephila clavipes]
MIIRQARIAPMVSLSTVQHTTDSSIPHVVRSTSLGRGIVPVTADFKTYVFDPTTSVVWFGEESQPIIMVAIRRIKQCSAINPALLLQQITIVLGFGEAGDHILHLRFKRHTATTPGIGFYLIRQQIISSHPPYTFNSSKIR